MSTDAKNACQHLMNFHVIAQMRDGSKFDGIIEGMDDEGVMMLVPEEIEGDWNPYQHGRQYGLDRRRYRRFRRQRFPFVNFVNPFFVPFPYYYPLPYVPYSYYGYGVGYGAGI